MLTLSDARIVDRDDAAPHAAADTLARRLLLEIGENPEREGLRDTPRRYRESMVYLTCGYSMDAEKAAGTAIFHEDSREAIVVRDIEFYSLCEHHLLPFYGKVHVAYMPNGKVIGLSKIPRLVEAYARRLQIQERLTAQIADGLDRVLAPLGVAVIIEAYHMCMMMRGVEKQSCFTVTRSLAGALENPEYRKELLDMIYRPRPA